MARKAAIAIVLASFARKSKHNPKLVIKALRKLEKEKLKRDKAKLTGYSLRHHTGQKARKEVKNHWAIEQVRTVTSKNSG